MLRVIFHVLRSMYMYIYIDSGHTENRQTDRQIDRQTDRQTNKVIAITLLCKIKKVCKIIGLIAKARIILDIDSIVMLYNAIVKPYFIYCNIIWGNTFTTYLKKLEKLQKKILRVMTSSEYNSHTGPLFY